ncbi:MAG TPA: hypothetical protein VK961_23450 [Chthoniobacter sp.]|nr:hypothetical protein [Chthoniobacter sp.]
MKFPVLLLILLLGFMASGAQAAVTAHFDLSHRHRHHHHHHRHHVHHHHHHVHIGVHI